MPEAPAAAEYTTTPKEALASEPGTAASPSRTPEETPAPGPSASAPETKPTVPVQAPSNPEPAPAAPAQSAPASSPPPASEELEPPQPVPEPSPQVDGTASGGGSGENFNTYNPAEQQNTQDSWVLNTNTMKIHYPSCSQVKKIAPQNYSTSNLSEGELKNQGYSTCGVCH